MLEGTLDTFTLPDIFQLLAFTKKTGCLHLDRDGATGRVWFKEGEVYYAVASSGRLMLGKRLVGAGLVSTEQVKEALSQQKDREGMRLGRILLEVGAVDEETLKTFVREQIQDSIFDLMRWSSGNFQFEHPIETDESIGLSVSTENLIMEGSRRLDEWDSVRKKVPGLDAVVDMAPAPGESGVEVNLQPEEWRLLALVDGRRTVGDLVDLSGQGEFMTCKLLYGMVGAGLLEVRDPDVHGPSSIAALLQQQELLRQLEDEDEVPRAATAPEAASEPVDEQVEQELDEEEAAEPIGPQEGSPEVVGEEAVDVPDEIDVPDDEVFEAAIEQADAQDVEDVDEAEAVEEAEVTDEPETADEEEPVAADEPAEAKSKHEQVKRTPDKRITTDPSVDPELLDRLIEGVKGL